MGCFDRRTGLDRSQRGEYQPRRDRVDMKRAQFREHMPFEAVEHIAGVTLGPGGKLPGMPFARYRFEALHLLCRGKGARKPPLN
jgi:hypothetical protein